MKAHPVNLHAIEKTAKELRSWTGINPAIVLALVEEVRYLREQVKRARYFLKAHHISADESFDELLDGDRQDRT
jgi:hypothetical protein